MLPYGLVWSKITNLDNLDIDGRILLFGKITKSFFMIIQFYTHILGGASGRRYNQTETYYDSILEFNKSTRSWAQIGAMTRPRAYHGVTNVNLEDFKSVCTFK